MACATGTSHLRRSGQTRGEDTPMLTCIGCRVERFCSADHQKTALKNAELGGSLTTGRQKDICGNADFDFFLGGSDRAVSQQSLATSPALRPSASSFPAAQGHVVDLGLKDLYVWCFPITSGPARCQAHLEPSASGGTGRFRAELSLTKFSPSRPLVYGGKLYGDCGVRCNKRI